MMKGIFTDTPRLSFYMLLLYFITIIRLKSAFVNICCSYGRTAHFIYIPKIDLPFAVRIMRVALYLAAHRSHCNPDFRFSGVDSHPAGLSDGCAPMLPPPKTPSSPVPFFAGRSAAAVR